MSGSKHSNDSVPGRQSDSAHSSNVVLPDEPEVPSEDPPPYSVVPDEGSVTLIPPSSNLPVNQRPQQAAANTQVRPPGNNNTSYQAPHAGYPGLQRPTFNGQQASSSFPPPPRPPSQQPQLPPRPPLQSGSYRPSPLHYPPGYRCRKCNNTGIKIKNGRTCKDCYAQFSRQSPNVQYINSGYNSGLGAMPGMGILGSVFGTLDNVLGRPYNQQTIYSPNGQPRIVMPGDPAIGGVLCGRCRGTGIINDFIFQDTCPTCHGVGRLL